MHHLLIESLDPFESNDVGQRVTPFLDDDLRERGIGRGDLVAGARPVVGVDGIFERYGHVRSR